MKRLNAGPQNFLNELKQFLAGKSEYDLLQTRDGRTVNIDKVDQHGAYPVRGVMKNPVGGGWTKATWRWTGAFAQDGAPHAGDLVLINTIAEETPDQALVESASAQELIEEVKRESEFFARLITHAQEGERSGQVLQTRSGVPVTILSLRGRDMWPIIGFVGEQTTPQAWKRSGLSNLDDSESPVDLLLVPRPPEHLGWFYMVRTNVAPHNPGQPIIYQSVGPFESQEWAQKNADNQSELVVAVFELTEKQGLE